MSEVEADGFVPVFEEPPPPRQRRRQSAVFTEEVVEALVANPNRWMVVVPEASVSGTTNAQNWAKRRPGFVVTSRTVVEGDRSSTKTPFRVYAKFDPSIVEREQRELEARLAAKAKEVKDNRKARRAARAEKKAAAKAAEEAAAAQAAQSEEQAS